MNTPKSKPSIEKAKSIARNIQVLREFKKSISPAAVAAADAAAKKALEEKYPGMFIPETKIAPSTRRRP
jgi:hypothetical protein